MLIDFINDIFRPLILTVGAIFSIYFGFKKIGDKVLAKYGLGKIDGYSLPTIRNVLLENKKDKFISIFSIHAVLNKELWIELGSYFPPEILKPNETLALEMEPYSQLSVGGDTLDLAPSDLFNAEIFIVSADKSIRCNSRITSHPIEKEKKVNVLRCQFNGFTFSKKVAYIVAYKIYDSEKTAFVNKKGVILNEWPFMDSTVSAQKMPASIFDKFSQKGIVDFTVYRVTQDLDLENVEN